MIPYGPPRSSEVRDANGHRCRTCGYDTGTGWGSTGPTVSPWKEQHAAEKQRMTEDLRRQQEQYPVSGYYNPPQHQGGGTPQEPYSPENIFEQMTSDPEAAKNPRYQDILIDEYRKSELYRVPPEQISNYLFQVESTIIAPYRGHLMRMQQQNPAMANQFYQRIMSPYQEFFSRMERLATGCLLSDMRQNYAA